jgi:hypothetical protein
MDKLIIFGLGKDVGDPGRGVSGSWLAAEF